MTVVGVLGTFETEAENSEIVARYIEAAGSKAIRIHRDEPMASKMRKLIASEVVYGTGFGFATKLWTLSRALGKRTINHWVGTDVMLARDDEAHRRMALQAAPRIQRHLAFAPWLQAELATIGIASEVSTYSRPIRIEPRRAAAAPAALAYLPDDRAAFYGAEIVRTLAAQLPDLPFGIVAGTAARQPALPNVTYLGWTNDMQPLYERYPILVRVAQHDGLPKMVLEALAYGNQVIFEYEFPHCYRANSEAEALAAIRQILAAGCPVNLEGSRFVREQYDSAQLAAALLAVIGVTPA